MCLLLMVVLQHVRPDGARHHPAQRAQRTAPHLVPQERAARAAQHRRAQSAVALGGAARRRSALAVVPGVLAAVLLLRVTVRTATTVLVAVLRRRRAPVRSRGRRVRRVAALALGRVGRGGDGVVVGGLGRRVGVVRRGVLLLGAVRVVVGLLVRVVVLVVLLLRRRWVSALRVIVRKTRELEGGKQSEKKKRWKSGRLTCCGGYGLWPPYCWCCCSGGG